MCVIYIGCIRWNHYQKKQSGNGQATCGNIFMCRYSSSLPWLISRKIRGVKAIDLLGPTAGKHVLFSLGVWNMTAELELESQSFAWFTLWIWWCWRFLFFIFICYMFESWHVNVVTVWICIMCGCFNMAGNQPGLGTRGLADHRTRLLQWVCSCLSWRWTMTGGGENLGTPYCVWKRSCRDGNCYPLIISKKLLNMPIL